MTKTIDPHPILPEATRDLADETATAALARSLACCARAGDVIALSGNLGTGKTSFARAFVRAFHEREDEEVPSPTFTLVQTYPGQRGELWHDLLRLKSYRIKHDSAMEMYVCKRICEEYDSPT